MCKKVNLTPHGFSSFFFCSLQALGGRPNFFSSRVCFTSFSEFTFAMILPLFTGVTLIVPAVLYAYKKIRPLFSVKVNCWFCGVRTVVPYGNFNCWDCPSCEQYNGFKEDGDYNKPIPAQHDERLNFSVPASCQSDSPPLEGKTRSQLCSACNYHQLVKVRLLANFTPTEEPWKQRVRLALALAASAAALYMSLVLLVAALGSEATLARCTARLGLDRIAAPPLWLLQPAGFVLAGSSVLLSGRQRLGRVALLLCLLWLLSVSCSQAAPLVDLARVRALLLGATAVAGAAHVLLLARAQLRGGAVRKLVGSSGSSLAASQPCSSSSGGASTYLPSWSDSASAHESVRSSRGRPLPDMMSDVHISPESERSWSTSTWSKPTSLRGSSVVVGGGGGGGRPPSLVWPPRLRLQGRGPSPGSSWAAAGAWAVGGQRTSSHTQLLWGIKQSFGLLTPPPSRDGSAKHSDGSSAAAGAAGQRRDADWGFFRQRDAFFSSSPDCSSGSQGWAPTHRGPRQAGSRRGYARSSISQASSLVEPKDGRETAGPAVPRRPLLPLALSSLLLGISAALNLALAFYLAARP
ncbi:uncharacterized protein LOC144144321 isoform X3 [Haemaphysalis longicornis]